MPHLLEGFLLVLLRGSTAFCQIVKGVHDKRLGTTGL